MYGTEILGSLSMCGELPFPIPAGYSIRNPFLARPISSYKLANVIPGGFPAMGRCTIEASKSLSGDVFSETSSRMSDVDYLGESTKGDLNLNFEHLEAFGIEGDATMEGPIEEIARVETEEAENLLSDLAPFFIEKFTSWHIL